MPSVEELRECVREVETIPAHLPNCLLLQDTLRKAKDWLQEAEAIQVTHTHTHTHTHTPTHTHTHTHTHTPTHTPSHLSLQPCFLLGFSFPPRALFLPLSLSFSLSLSLFSSLSPCPLL